MPIEAGQQVPDVEVKRMGAEGPESVQTGDVLGSGKVVLFAVPGAFTPGCSNTHLPGFVERVDELKGKGVDRIVCTAVNDAWVMDAWSSAHDAGQIEMLADGNADFARAMDLVLDGSGFGLGPRSKRYAAIIEDGVITQIDVDESGIDVSTCSAVLARL